MENYLFKLTKAVTKRGAIFLPSKDKNGCDDHSFEPFGAKDERGNLITTYNWTDVKTEKKATYDAKHPFILTWFAPLNSGYNQTEEKGDYSYKLAVSYKWLVEHCGIRMTEAELKNRVTLSGGPENVMIVEERHENEYYMGHRISPDVKEITFNGVTYKCNRYADNGLGDRLMIPCDSRGNIDPNAQPFIVDGLDADHFYRIMTPETTAHIQSPSKIKTVS